MLTSSTILEVTFQALQGCRERAASFLPLRESRVAENRSRDAAAHLFKITPVLSHADELYFTRCASVHQEVARAHQSSSSCSSLSCAYSSCSASTNFAKSCNKTFCLHHARVHADMNCFQWGRHAPLPPPPHAALPPPPAPSASGQLQPAKIQPSTGTFLRLTSCQVCCKCRWLCAGALPPPPPSSL